MGASRAIDMATAVDEGLLNLEAAVADQLQHNHYPPVPLEFVPVAMEAIEKAGAGEWEFEQHYPNGLTRTVAHTVEGLHLDAFLGQEDEL